jgi:hypothetical protein
MFCCTYCPVYLTKSIPNCGPFLHNEGLTNNTYFNNALYDYVTWLWRKGPQFGIDLVKYTGQYVQQNIPHNLGNEPDVIIIKGYDTSLTTDNWVVYNLRYISNIPDPWTDTMWLDTTHVATDFNYFGDVRATKDYFTVTANQNDVNIDGKEYIAILFRQIYGFSQFDFLIGNSGDDENCVVPLSFSPRWLMLKRNSGNNSDWYIWDSERNTINPRDKAVFTAGAHNESTNDNIDFLGRGFRSRWTGLSPNHWVYWAFADYPGRFTNARI